MAMSYTELTGDKTVAGSIRSWINYGKIDVENVLLEAQATLYQSLRVREMKASATLSVGASVDYIDLPENHLSTIKLRDVTNDLDLLPKDWEELEEYRSWTNGSLDTGDPTFFAVYEERIQFDVKTRAVFSARMLYFKQPAMLGNNNPTNFLTRKYPQLLRPACLAMAAVNFKDNETYTREMQRLSALIVGVNVQDDLDAHRGENIQIIGP